MTLTTDRQHPSPDASVPQSYVADRGTEQRLGGALGSHDSHARQSKQARDFIGGIAVLAPSGIRQYGQPALPLPRDIENLARLADAKGIRQFWIHESALPVLGFPEAIRTNAVNGYVAHPFFSTSQRNSSKPGLAGWSHWWGEGVQGFDVHIPAYGGGRSVHPFRGLERASDLLLEVTRFADATGLRWCGSAGITSDNYLRRKLKKRIAPTLCPDPIIDRRAEEHACVWKRTPDEREVRSYHYCHYLDLNSAYLSPASSLELPTGKPRFMEWPDFDKRLPGLYLFDPGPWPLESPCLWSTDHNAEEGASVWVTAPTAQRMIEMGYEPLEAWVWDSHGRHLRAWYELLRGAREQLLSGGAALEAVKDVIRSGLGRMASEDRTLPRGAEFLEDDPMFQPYWDWAVVAEVRCRLLARLPKTGMLPVAVDTDSMFVLSSRPTPEAAAAALGLPTGDGLGQFRGKGTARAKDAAEALGSPDVTPTDGIKALRALYK